MSGATIGGIAGGIIGSFIPVVGTQLGFVIGSMIGGLVDPEKIYGPRLTDAQAQTSQVGVPIVFGFGTFPTAGNIIWAGSLRERKKKERAGKGGPEQVTYQYLRSYAIGICEGPIKAIKTIKRNGKVVYEAGANAAGEYTGDTGSLTSASRKFLQKCTIYRGDESQMPDPTIEAVVGAGNVSPFRGLAYIVIRDDDLTDFRGAIPQYEFVVAMEGQDGEAAGVFDAIGYDDTWPWIDKPVGARDPRRRGQAYEYGNVWTDTWYANVDDAIADVAAYSGQPLIGAPLLRGWATVTRANDTSFHGAQFSTNGTANPAVPTPNRLTSGGPSNVGSRDVLGLIYSRTSFGGEHDFFASSAAVVNNAGGGWFPDNVSATGSAVWRPYDGAPSGGQSYSFGTAPGSQFMIYYDLVVAVRPVMGCEHIPPGYPVPDAPGYYAQADGTLIYQGECAPVTGAFKQLSIKISATDGTGSFTGFDSLPLGPVLQPSDPNYNNQAFWDAAYAAAAAAGKMREGRTYAPTGATTGSARYPMLVTSACQCEPPLVTVARDRVLLASIVAALCARSGLTAAQYDVSQLTDLVDGYKCATIGDGASYIAPLAQAYFFDVGEWDAKVRFIKRGGATAFALTADDLVERDGPAIEEERVQEAELLRKTTVAYIDPAAGFTPATQDAERLVSTIQAKGESATEIPIVMTAADAAKIADKRIKVAWAEPDKLKFSLPYRFAYLTPSDVGTLTDRKGKVHRLRIMEVQEDSGVLLIEASRDSRAAYNSNAVGVEPKPPTVTTPGLIGGTQLEILNIPILRDEHDQLGVYLAARGQLSGWPGAEIQLSTDGGATGSTFATITEAATIGYTLSALAPTVPDYPAEQTLDVWLPDPPESVDYATLLRYNNRAVIGDEIVQYQTVTDLGARQYRLGGLVRNRYDTAPVAHAAGDRFVLIDAALVFVQAQQWMLGQTLYFKAVSLGTSADAYAWQPYRFTTAASQTEWRPTMVRARDVGADLVVSWLGRGRLGTGLNAYPSQHFRGYRVTYTNGVNVVTHDVTTTTDTLAGGASLPGVVTISVAGLNAITGPGHPSEVINA